MSKVIQPETPPAPAPAAEPLRKHLHGPPYRNFVWGVLKMKAARNYLEVGVRSGSTLVGVECPAIGVDPQFLFERNPVGGKRILHLYQMTSDDYFRDHDPRQVLGGPVDVAFLDGMHLFEFLLRDFFNTERVCGRNSLIMLDDCLPLNIEMTERVLRPELRKDASVPSSWWAGDVWKVVSILREFRPDLRITPVDVNPTGSIMVSNLDPDSTLLRDRYFEIVDRYRPLELTPENFEDYWTVNQPLPVEQIAANFNFSLFMRP